MDLWGFQHIGWGKGQKEVCLNMSEPKNTLEMIHCRFYVVIDVIWFWHTHMAGYVLLASLQDWKLTVPTCWEAKLSVFRIPIWCSKSLKAIHTGRDRGIRLRVWRLLTAGWQAKSGDIFVFHFIETGDFTWVFPAILHKAQEYDDSELTRWSSLISIG